MLNPHKMKVFFEAYLSYTYLNFACLVTPTNILYTGRMYHEKKEVGHWITIYSVVRDLEVLKQVGDNKMIFKFFDVCSILMTSTLMLNQVMWLISLILINQMEFFNYTYKLHNS